MICIVEGEIFTTDVLKQQYKTQLNSKVTT